MSNATIEQLNERYEQVTTEAKAALEKLNTAVRGAYTRLEENGNELFQTLVKLILGMHTRYLSAT